MFPVAGIMPSEVAQGGVNYMPRINWLHFSREELSYVLRESHIQDLSPMTFSEVPRRRRPRLVIETVIYKYFFEHFVQPHILYRFVISLLSTGIVFSCKVQIYIAALIQLISF